MHETSVIQTRSSEDRKDFNVEQAHKRMGRPVITHDVINVSDSSQTRSVHQSETFNVGDETLRERTEGSVIDHNSAKHAYHAGILASSSAHAGIYCTQEQRSIENSLNIRWTFFQSFSMSSRREDLMDTDMGESQETKNIVWLTN